MKRSRVALIILLLMLFGVVGVAIGATIFQRNLAASVTIQAQGTFTFQDVDGSEVSTLQYGELAPGEHSNIMVILANTGNCVLNVTGSRIDSASDINVRYLNADGSAFNPNSLKLISPGAEVVIVIDLWSDANALGAYQVEFLFEGTEA